MIETAVVGLGSWGPKLLRNAMSSNELNVKVICDLDRDRVEQFCGLYPTVHGTTQLKKIANDSSLSAVIIATPAGLHPEHTQMFLESGKHVFVEKPVALTTKEATHLDSIARKNERILMVGHTFLYNAAVNKIRDLIHSGEIGKPLFILSRRMSLGQVRKDVNVLWNLCPHDFSIIQYILGTDPLWVQASGASWLQEKHADLVLVTLGLPDGVLAHIEANWLNPIKMREMIVVGEKKMIVYDDVKPEGKIAVYDSGFDRKQTHLEDGSFGTFQLQIRRGDVWIPHIDFKEPLSQELAEFAAAINEGRAPLTGGAHAISITRALEAAQKSLDTDGKRIAF